MSDKRDEIVSMGQNVRKQGCCTYRDKIATHGDGDNGGGRRTTSTTDPDPSRVCSPGAGYYWGASADAMLA